MKSLRAFFQRDTHFATAMCFAGFYVISVGTVVSIIKGTQMLLGLI